MYEERIRELELKYESLKELISLIDEYSRHIMGQTLTQLSILIAIATTVIIGAAYFMVKSIINNKVEKEIEKKVSNILRDYPPVFYAKGKSSPDENGRIFLSNEIKGINDLEPSTIMIIDVKPEKVTWGQMGNSFNPKLKINEEGIREIELDNYYENNGQIVWSLIWVRKNYE